MEVTLQRMKIHFAKQELRRNKKTIPSGLRRHPPLHKGDCTKPKPPLWCSFAGDAGVVGFAQQSSEGLQQTIPHPLRGMPPEMRSISPHGAFTYFEPSLHKEGEVAALADGGVVYTTPPGT